MNYAELSAAIQSYAENYETSFITNIPTFIKQAEHRIYNSVQIPIFRTTSAYTIAAGSPYIDSDPFLAIYSVAITVNNSTLYLINKDRTYMEEAYPSLFNGSTGIPKYYCVDPGTISGSTRGLGLLVAPCPATETQASVQFYSYPNSIVDDSTSWLGDNYDPILLYGAMREAMLYMKAEQDLVTYYETKYQESLAQLKRLCEGLEMGDAYRGGQVKIPEKAL